MTDITTAIPEPEEMLLDLLRSGCLIVSTTWWKKDWPDDARDMITVAVVCNDLFGPMSDAEMLPFSQLHRAWELHQTDPRLGLMVWCIGRRKRMPWAKALKSFKGSQWDLEKIVKGFDAEEQEP